MYPPWLRKRYARTCAHKAHPSPPELPSAAGRHGEIISQLWHVTAQNREIPKPTPLIFSLPPPCFSQKPAFFPTDIICRTQLGNYFPMASCTGRNWEIHLLPGTCGHHPSERQNIGTPEITNWWQDRQHAPRPSTVQLVHFPSKAQCSYSKPDVALPLPLRR